MGLLWRRGKLTGWMTGRRSWLLGLEFTVHRESVALPVLMFLA